MNYTLELPVKGINASSRMRHTIRNVQDLIKQKWSKLSEEEVSNYRIDPQQFYTAIRRAYNVSQEEIELQLNILKRKALYAMS